MTNTQTAPAPPSPPSHKASRFALVTIAATPVNIAVYWVLLALGLPSIIANLAAATVVTVPTFVVNRRWVWPGASGGSQRAMAFRYWLSSVANVGVATAVLALVIGAGAGDVVLLFTPPVVYAALFVLRFLYLDRVVFNRG